MDDSCWDKTGIIICTDSLTLNECFRLMSVIEIKFGIQCRIRGINSNKYRIYIRAVSIPQVRSLVIPYFHPSMLYKLGL